MSAPPPIPVVPAGTVLTFAAGDSRYDDGDLRLRVSRVREELARHYGGHWVWIDGERLDAEGNDLGPKQLLVATTALVRAVAQLGQAETTEGGEVP